VIPDVEIFYMENNFPAENVSIKPKESQWNDLFEMINDKIDDENKMSEENLMNLFQDFIKKVK
jgi:hypothetical protein